MYLRHRARDDTPLASIALAPRVPSLPLAPLADRSPRSPRTSPSSPVKIKQKAEAKRPDDAGFYDAETPEEFAKRKADAQSRIAGIEAMLKEQAAQLEASKAEAEASVAQLRQVMSEKNTVERMLEEMERKKEAAEFESERMRDENNKLLDTVTVLTDARAADHQAHAVTVRKWRDSLVAYQEKTPTEFLAEILALVSDMDNEVEIEIADADVAARRKNGGERVAKEEELALCEEWSHNPTLAMARPDRLCRLASRTRAPLALGDGPAQTLAAAGAKSGGGTSGVEIKMSTPVQAAKRRTALGAVDLNAARVALVDAPVSASPVAAATVKPVAKPIADVSPRTALRQELVAARSEMKALKNESAAAGLLETQFVDFEPTSASSPSAMKPLGSRDARAFGPAKASVNLSFFGGASGATKKMVQKPSGPKPSRAAAAVGMYQSVAFDDFGAENVAPVGGRSIIASPR